MHFEQFFDIINFHFNQDLPFVCFGKKGQLKAYLQNNSELHELHDFSQSGFVFAPFTNKHPSVIFDVHSSEIIETTLSTIEIESIKNESLFTSNLVLANNDRRRHLDLVSEAITHINNSDVTKIVCSRQIVIKHTINPLRTFKALYANYPNAFCYCWFHPKVGLWLGATPEQFVHIEHNRLKTVALAGTQNKAEFPEPNWSKKEEEEQQMVTDFIFNVLKKYSDNVYISERETVEAGNLWHLKTKIKATIITKDLADLFEDLHPTSAVCGLPKEEALDFVLNHEGYDRQYYTGYLGEINSKQEIGRTRKKRNQEHQAIKSIKKITDMYVNLRCMQVKNDNILIYVGGGITKDSNPENEYQETLAKSETMLNVL